MRCVDISKGVLLKICYCIEIYRKPCHLSVYALRKNLHIIYDILMFFLDFIKFFESSISFLSKYLRQSQMKCKQIVVMISCRGLILKLNRCQCFKDLFDKGNTHQDAVSVSQVPIIGESVGCIRVQTG